VRPKSFAINQRGIDAPIYVKQLPMLNAYSAKLNGLFPAFSDPDFEQLKTQQVR